MTVQGVLADLVLVVHLLFILFVVAGALLVLRWRFVAWLHVPAAVWGAWLEFSGAICPLTPVENWLRKGAGQSGYEGAFVEHYLVPLIYPVGLTQQLQWGLGALVVILNAGLYAWLLGRAARRSSAR